ncbi:MAG: amidohydrolase family protein [Sphaerochaetaceae bacterium]|nr:amidohydrolase family protein [Sphaerochaetaceae bacterium]
MNTSYCIKGATAVSGDKLIEDAVIVVKDGIITSIGPRLTNSEVECEHIDGTGMIAGPAFIDMHLHGAGGFDPGEPGISKQETSERLVALNGYLKEKGIATWALATVFDMETINHVGSVLKENNTLQDHLAGLYVEGPFVHPDKRGGIPLKTIHAFSETLLQSILTGGPVIRLMTIAPELPGIESAVKLLEKHHVTVCWGHSTVKLDQIGVFKHAHLTHLFNAMDGFDHKQPGLAMLPFLNTAADVTFEIIADSIHVHPSMLEFVCTHPKSLHHACLISDAVGLAGVGPTTGFYRGEEIFSDGVAARYVHGNVLVGSATLITDSIRMLYAQGMVDYRMAFRMASTNPAKVLGYSNRGSLTVGNRADIVLCDQTLKVRKVLMHTD